MLPDQRGILSSWVSGFRGDKRRAARRKRNYFRQSSMETLEPRVVLTNTLFVDFGDNMNSVQMKENTTRTTAGWTTFGYLPPNNVATGGAGTSWLLGPQFTYAGNPNITYTPFQDVFTQKGVTFNIGQTPTNDPFEFQSGSQAPVSQYDLIEQSIIQQLTEIFSPFNIQVVGLTGPAGADGFGGATRNGTNVASILAANNPLLEPNTFDPANPPTDAAGIAALRGADFLPTSITGGGGFQYQDAYILVGGWTLDSGAQVGDDGQLGIFGAGNADLLVAGAPLTFPDPTLGNPKYSDGGGAVVADEIVDKALASGYNGTTNVPGAMNPNVAIAGVAAQIAAQSWGLFHTSDGEAKFFNPFFDTNIDLLSSSDVMRQGAGPTPNSTVFPTATDMPFVERYSMMLGDANQNPTDILPALTPGRTDAYDQLVKDPDIGPNAGGLLGNPFPNGIADYVSGTGAFDKIIITKLDATHATVTVRPYLDSSFSTASFLSSFVADPTHPAGRMTSEADPLTYTITTSSAKPVLVELGRSADILQIDATISDRFVVEGGAGVDNLIMSGTGAQNVTVTPANINSQAFNFDSRFDTVISTSGGARVEANEFDDTSTLHLENLASLTFEIPHFLGSKISLTSRPGSSIPVIGSLAEETTIDGTAGPTALSALVGFSNVEFTNVTTATVEDPVGTVTDAVTVDNSAGAFAAGLQNLNLLTGPGDDSVTLKSINFSLPGVFTIDGGTGNDTLNAIGNTDWTLTNTTGSSGGGGTVQILNVENANITGGVGNNTLTITNWAGTATIDGSDGNDTINLGDATHAVTGNITVTGGNGNDTFNINNVSAGATLSVSGNAGDDTFNVGATGAVLASFPIDGGEGNNTFNIINWAGSGNLTAGSGNDSFYVKTWTGTGTLHGGAGDDKFVFGTLSTSSPSGNGNLDGITQSHAVFGDLGNDTVTLDDSANPAATQNYTVTANSASDSNGFSGITFDSTLENLGVIGSQVANTFSVAANLRTAISIDGQNPTTATGDSLVVTNLADTKGIKSSVSAGTTTLTFTSGHKPISYKNIETAPDLPVVIPQQQAQQQAQAAQDLINQLTNDPLLVGASDAGKGSTPLVKIYDVTPGGTNQVLLSFYAYETTLNGAAKAFAGGVRATIADVDGDGVPDVIVAPGAGRVGEVKVYSGKTLAAGADSTTAHLVANSDAAIIPAAGPLSVMFTGAQTGVIGLVGKTIEGTSIPLGAVINAIPNATTLTLSAAASATATITATVDSGGTPILLTLKTTKNKVAATVVSVISVGGMAVGQSIVGGNTESVTTTIGSAVITVPSAANYVVGELVTGEFIPGNTTIAFKTATTLTLSHPATTSGATTVVIDPINSNTTVTALKFGIAGVTLTLSAAVHGTGANAVYAGGYLPEGAAYKNGLYIAVGDVDGDGAADLVTSRSAGVPEVRVFTNDGAGSFTQTLAFAPYLPKEKVTTGAVVGIGDVDGDGLADIVTVPGTGSVVTVKVFSGQTSALEHQFLGFESTFKNSASLTLGDTNGDGVDEIMLGAGAGGTSRVRTFDGFGTLLSQFKAYTTGVVNAPLRIVAHEVNGSLVLFTAQSNDGRSRAIEGFNPLTGAMVDTFFDTDAAFNPGEFLG